MTSPYLTLRNRLLAIVCDARGADGSLGADALAKSIPLGRFRRAQDGAPLRDPAYPAGALDRAVRVDWLSEADDEGVLPDPADRAAFKEYTDMITARECIAVVARRAELYQAAVHLEARPSVSLALVNVAGSRERSAARSVPTNVCGLGGTVARAFANLLTRLSL